MGTFHKVEGEQAGATALGILIPPSRRTFVILRPRALPWDLLLCRPDGAFHELSHDEASAAAQSIYRLLREVSVTVVADESSIRATIGPFRFVACLRRPGQPYAPHAFDEASAAIEKFRGVLCPGDGVAQELYFNTRFFDRAQEPPQRPSK